MQLKPAGRLGLIAEGEIFQRGLQPLAPGTVGGAASYE
jgi:hypothetical protein